MHRRVRTPGRVAAGVVSFALALTSILGPVPVAFAQEASPQIAVTAPAETDPVELAAPVLPSPTPPAPAPVAPTAKRELVEKRTVDSRTFLLPDGRNQLQVYAAPIHYRDAATKRFEPIRSELVTDTTSPTRTWKNRANAFTLSIPRAGAREYTRIEEGGRFVAWRPATRMESGFARGLDTTGTPDGPAGKASTVRFEQAFPLSRIEMESDSRGVKETIVIDHWTGANRWSFDVICGGVTPRMDASGAISWLGSDGEDSVFVMPAPYMTDSSTDALGDPALSTDVRYELTPQGLGWRLDVVADEAWLTDPARIYPVSVDPTTRWSRGGDSAGWYWSKYPNANYQDTHQGTNPVWHKLVSGTRPGADYGSFTTCIRMGTSELDAWAVARASEGARIETATLSAWTFYDYSTNSDHWEIVREITSYWYAGIISWNSIASGNPACTGIVATTKITPGARSYWDVTSAVREWVDLGHVNRGWRFFGNGGATNSYFQMESPFGTVPPSGGEDYKPRLDVYYVVPPSATIIPPPAQATPGVAPRVHWSYAESLGHPQAAHRVEVAASSGGPALGIAEASGNATSALVPTPSGGWSPGSAYWTRVTVASTSTVGGLLWSTPTAWSRVVPGVLPAPVSTETTSSAWTAEDADGDGAAEYNESNSGGRGSTYLSWERAASADGYRIYLSDGSQWRAVGSSTATGWTSAGAGLYPSDSAIASRSADATSSPYLSGTGLDLRDDPSLLYAKTPGAALDTFPGYAFKVAPLNGAIEVPLSACSTITVQLPERTRHLDGVPADTTADLGTFAGHSVRSVLDSAAGDPARLELSVTDLAIASWGPEAALSRTYRSDVTTDGLFAPGWRFSFEQSISEDASGAVWTDATGAQVRFRSLGGGTFAAPRSVVATLTHPFSANPWTLELKGGTTLVFDQSGQITSEKDRNDNEVFYVRGQDAVTITADNGQSIDVSLEGSRVVGATYLGREVSYEYDSSEATVTSFPGTGASSTVAYRYDGGGRLSSMSVPGFEGTDELAAEWGFVYQGDGSALSSVRYPGYAGDGHRRGDITYGGDGTSAVLTRFGEVDGTADTPVATTWTWHPTGEVATQSNPGSATTFASYEYNSVGQTCLERSPMGKTTLAETDVRGNIVESTDEGGRITTTLYAGDDAVSTVDPNGSVTTYGYDARGNVILEEKTLDETGRHSSAESSYTAEGLLLETRSKIATDTWAITSYADFSSSGQPRTTTEHGVQLSAAAAATDLERHATYRPDGVLLTESVTHLPSGPAPAQATSNSIDVAGRVTESEDASGVVTHTRYDALGNANETWRSHESTATKVDWRTMEYDSAGRRTLEKRLGADGDVVSSVTHVYDKMDREVRSDDSSVPGFSETRYDASGNAVKVWSEGAQLTRPNSETRITTDADGAQTKQIAPGAVTAATTTTYAPDGAVTFEQQPDGSSVSYEYDEAGDLESETTPSDEGDAETTYDSDLDGNTVAVTSPEQVTTVSDHDLMGRVVGTRAGAQQMTTTTYNTLGWVLATTDFDGVDKSYVYDEAGRVLEESIGGLVTTSRFDAIGHELARANPDGSGVSTDYDVFGRAATVMQTGTGGTVAHRVVTALDDAGRPLRIDDEVTGLTRQYAYADGGHTMTETRPGQGTVMATTDGTGLLVSLEADLLGAHADWSVTATDTAGRVIDASSSTFANDWNLAYDEAGRPVSVASASNWRSGKWGMFEWACPGMVIAGVGPDGTQYGYSPTTGAKISEVFGFNCEAVGSESTTYTYTLTGRLAWATKDDLATAYDYDPLSGALSAYRRPNEATTTLTYDAQGHLHTAGTRHYDSDPLGRRIFAGPSTIPSETAYSWSGERLVTYRRPSVAATHTYDATGQRTRSVVASGSITTTTTWTYDGITLLGAAAARSDGTTWSVGYLRDERNVVFAGVYGATNTTATPFLMVTTDRGDVRELLDASGAAFAFYAYDAFGNPTTSMTARTALVDTATVEAIAERQPLRYASYTWDADQGLYYCSQRYYDPSVAAFISKDPARADGEQSAYQYCGGDPVGMSDPSGLFTLTIHSVVRAGTGNPITEYCGEHSWISIKAMGRRLRYGTGVTINRGETLTLGTFPAQGGHDAGLYYNWEPTNRYPHQEWGQLSVYVPDPRFRSLMKRANQLDGWALGVNCAGFALKIWNQYAGKKNTLKVTYPVLPKKLFRAINSRRGHQHKVGEWGKQNGFQSDHAPL